MVNRILVNVFVTGFGPFGDAQVNPSEVLASRCGRPYRVLEVSFAAVESFLNFSLDLEADAFLLLGLNAKAKDWALETVAHNFVGTALDVLGEGGPGPIDPRLPPRLAGTLWTPAQITQCESPWGSSVDPGRYLCNYLFFRMLVAHPKRKVGFLHVPPFETLEQGIQHQMLRSLLECLETAG